MKLPDIGNWTFKNEAIAKGFDEHVREQLPWYDLATGVITHVVRHYLPRNGLIYDIGASTGNITNSLKETIELRKATAVSIEPSSDMIKQFRGSGEVVKAKAEDFDFKNFDVAVLFLTMMFIPVAKRKEFLDNLKSKLNKGGCIIIFDKDEPKNGYLSVVMSRLALAGKLAKGADPADILKKELSLSGVQRNYKCQDKQAVKIFKFGDFTGWIIEGGNQ